MDGSINREDTRFIDLSRSSFDEGECVSSILQQTESDQLLFFSPLAQNFEFAANVSTRLRAMGYRTVVGGNMASLSTTAQFDVAVDGVIGSNFYDSIQRALDGRSERTIRIVPKLGRSIEPVFYRPRYRLLKSFGKRAPMLRLNASHGCLYGCTFCGDAWSRQLHLVKRELLVEEADELRRMFPTTKTVYVGDKTFGQSLEAMDNLRFAIDPHWGWQLIVQTHASVVDEKLVERMLALDVVACEMGFETGDAPLLRDLKKGANVVRVDKAIELLHSAGIQVILNVMGGLPQSTRESAALTKRFMTETADRTYLYNLYNFVPYPKTPLYPLLKDRIVDWNFANWREDMPVVFTPFKQTSSELWDDFISIIDHAHQLIRKRV